MSSFATPPAPVAGSPKGPFRLAVAMICVTTVTILWGAMTTSTGSGMAFTDWPLSDGELMPERSYTTVPGFLEHFHRIFGALAGALTLWLVLWLQFGRVGRPAARRTAWFALALIIVQGVVGGVGVLLGTAKGTPGLTSVIHGLLAQVTLSTFAWIAFQLTAHYDDPPAVPGGGGRRLAMVTLAILVLQTLVGGIARHTNSAHALWTHVGNAFVVFVVGVIATGFAVGRLRAVHGLQRVAKWLASLMILQIVLGFIALLIRNSAGKTPENVANLGTALLISFHVLLGALLTVLAATMWAHVYRGTRPVGAGGG